MQWLTNNLSFLFFAVLFSHVVMADSYENQRQQMVVDIEKDVVRTAHYLDKNKLDQRVMDAMATVPRHKFVPTLQVPYAYFNIPLGIGSGQTISQPYIVAIMTDLINPEPGHVVLEVGTGSGYQAAVLSKLVKKVYSIEIIPQLAKNARQTLEKLGYNNVHVRHGDGYKGWPDAAPFDSIIVTAGGKVPPLLIEQLKPGGRMIIPVGESGSTQYLTLIVKSDDGEITKRKVLPVRFVPLVEGN